MKCMSRRHEVFDSVRRLLVLSCSRASRSLADSRERPARLYVVSTDRSGAEAVQTLLIHSLESDRCTAPAASRARRVPAILARGEAPYPRTITLLMNAMCSARLVARHLQSVWPPSTSNTIVDGRHRASVWLPEAYTRGVAFTNARSGARTTTLHRFSHRAFTLSLTQQAYWHYTR